MIVTEFALSQLRQVLEVGHADLASDIDLCAELWIIVDDIKKVLFVKHVELTVFSFFDHQFLSPRIVDNQFEIAGNAQCAWKFAPETAFGQYSTLESCVTIGIRIEVSRQHSCASIEEIEFVHSFTLFNQYCANFFHPAPQH